jgi:hypothetical protein
VHASKAAPELDSQAIVSKQKKDTKTWFAIGLPLFRPKIVPFFRTRQYRPRTLETTHPLDARPKLKPASANG